MRAHADLTNCTRCVITRATYSSGDRSMSRTLFGILTLLSLVSAGPARGQTAPVRVTGTVTGAADGSPLSGARVVVKGTSIGTLTGTNGRYTIDARSTNDTLTFAFIGYRPIEVAIAGRSVVNATMEAAAIMMEEEIGRASCRDRG